MNGRRERGSDSGANEETQNADADAVDDVLSVATTCLKNAVNENAVNGQKTCKRDSKEHGQGSRIKDHAHIN
eukprot:scaffold13606_cov118-Isochrysis_galbana.AAC.1